MRAEVLDLQKRSIQYNILKREVDTNRSLYDGLLQRYKEVDVASGVGANNVFVVDRAELPRLAVLAADVARCSCSRCSSGWVPASPPPTSSSASTTRSGSPEEVERITGLATLGIIPKRLGGRRASSMKWPTRARRMSEAYRSLCTALQFSTESGLPRTLFVTSAGPSEGKSLTSLAIARHFATIGLKVLLIDADLRNPSLHTKLGLDNRDRASATT